ncbi:MAG: hypothetical protein A2W23_04195 [Planctomycetes bacterium RBG_16_43_13]|nr:MAG: hypothetical protein A2W23_04195 [Planctomycetes bacterium RBG_16_43_13]
MVEGRAFIILIIFLLCIVSAIPSCSREPDADEIKAYWLSAIMNEANGYHEQAIEDWSKLISVTPLVKINKKSQSIQEDFQQAGQWTLNMYVGMAYNGRGDAKYKLGNYSGAISDWERAIEVNEYYMTGVKLMGSDKPYDSNERSEGLRKKISEAKAKIR